MSDASRIRINRIMKLGFQASALVLLTIAALAACNRSSSKPEVAVSDKLGGAVAPAAAPAAKAVDLEKPIIKIETTEGSITIRLDGIRSPGTVRNFINYANDGFYENTLVHYVD